GPGDELAPLGGDPPDAALRYVAARDAEVDLAVLDDRIIPIGNVYGTVGAHLVVQGEGGGGRALYQCGQLPARGDSAGGGELDAADAVRAEVVGDQGAAPRFGQVPAAEDLQAAVLGAAGDHALEEARPARRGGVGGAGEDVGGALEAGAVGHERLPPAVEV